MAEESTDRGRLYWLIHNIRKRTFSAIGGWIRRHKFLSIVLGIVLIYALFTGRASYHFIVLGIRKYILLILIVLAAFWWYLRVLKRSKASKGLAMSLVLLGFVALCWWLGPRLHHYLGLYVRYVELETSQLTALPISDHERIQPFNSISTLINQEALSETEDATAPKFVRMPNESYAFSSCVGPSREYSIQRLTKNQYELLHIPATLPSPLFTADYRDEVNFEVGELLLFSHHTAYAVIKRFHPWQYLNLEPTEPVFVRDDKNKWVQVVPLIRWKGILFPRPVFGGVVLIGEKTKKDNMMKRILMGKGKVVKRDELEKYAFLKGQNLIPERVANFIAQSFRFTNGFLAPMPGYHEGDIRIPKLPKDQKSQPFIAYFEMHDEGKIYNYYGLEPFQEEKKGLSLSLFIPGDGEESVYYMDHRNARESFIGSSAISAKIIESKKNYDWKENYPAESRPFIRNILGKRRLFWLSTIVTRAGQEEGEYIGGSIPEICLTDAIHGKVTWIKQDSLINQDAWLRQVSSELNEYWEKVGQ